MPRPSGSTNVRPTRIELADARRLTKARAAEGDADALSALATHRLADVLEQALGALGPPGGVGLDVSLHPGRLR